MVAEALCHELFELLATGLGDALALLLPAAWPPRALLPSRQLLRSPVHPRGFEHKSLCVAAAQIRCHCQTRYTADVTCCPAYPDASSVPCWL